MMPYLTIFKQIINNDINFDKLLQTNKFHYAYENSKFTNPETIENYNKELLRLFNDDKLISEFIKNRKTDIPLISSQIYYSLANYEDNLLEFYYYFLNNEMDYAISIINYKNETTNKDTSAAFLNTQLITIKETLEVATQKYINSNSKYRIAKMRWDVPVLERKNNINYLVSFFLQRLYIEIHLILDAVLNKKTDFHVLLEKMTRYVLDKNLREIHKMALDEYYMQQDKNSNLLYTNNNSDELPDLRKDFRQPKKGVLDYDTIIAKPNDFAILEKLLFKYQYIDADREYIGKHGSKNKFAKIILYCIDKGYFRDYDSVTQTKLTTKHFAKFIEYRYNSAITKQVNTFKNKPIDVKSFANEDPLIKELI